LLLSRIATKLRYSNTTMSKLARMPSSSLTCPHPVLSPVAGAPPNNASIQILQKQLYRMLKPFIPPVAVASMAI
jgi:hypothetical protein